MFQFADVQTYLSAALLLPQYGGYGIPAKKMPTFDHGPGTDPEILAQNPDTLVIITLTGGPGLEVENLFDAAGLQIRTIGPQQDYTGGEALAQNCDKALVAIDHSQFINGKWFLAIRRMGGPPSLLLKDDGDRYHFTCNYIPEVQY